MPDRRNESSAAQGRLERLEAVAKAAREFRAEHPAWSPDGFDEDSILEALHGGDSPGARLDAALAALDGEAA